MFNAKRSFKFAAAVFLYAICGGAAKATLITNGSFEITTASVPIAAPFPNGVGVLVTGWGNLGLGGDLLVTPNWFPFPGQVVPGVGIWGPLPATSPDGGNFVLSDGNYLNSPITQTISGLIVNALYELTFYQALAQAKEIIYPPGAVSGNWQVTFGTATQFTPLMNADGSIPTISPWAPQTLLFTATSAVQTLSFLSVGMGLPPFVGLDGVSLVAVSEPESLGLVALGGVLVAWRLRRRRYPARTEA